MSALDRDSFDAVAEDIAQSLHSAFEAYAPLVDWIDLDESDDIHQLWDKLSMERKALLIAVVKKLLLLDKIQPGANTVKGK